MSSQSKAETVVYIVDDDEDVRGGIKSLFESVGLRVEAFNSTADFLKHHRDEQPSCLILDVRLPGLSGLDLQDELIKAQVEIPVIFLSGHGDIPMTVKAMKAGALEFLTKPVREQDLLDAVRAAIEIDSKRRDQASKMDSLRARFATLSLREQKVMSRVCDGLMNKQIAGELGVSEVTIKVHRHNLMKKLAAKSLAELIKMADRLGISRKI
jgi:FixJ family two-component response regulator